MMTQQCFIVIMKKYYMSTLYVIIIINILISIVLAIYIITGYHIILHIIREKQINIYLSIPKPSNIRLFINHHHLLFLILSQIVYYKI